MIGYDSPRKIVVNFINAVASLSLETAILKKYSSHLYTFLSYLEKEG